MLSRHLAFLSLSFLLLFASESNASRLGTLTIEDTLPLDAYGDVLDGELRARLGSTRLMHKNKITGLAVTSSGELVASGALDGEVRVWSTADGLELFAKSVGNGGVRSVSISADGVRVAAGSTGNFAIVWNVLTGEELIRVDGGDIAAISPDGKTLAVAGKDDQFQLVSLDVEESRKIEGSGYLPTTLVFSPDGALVVKTVLNKERASADNEDPVLAVLEVYSFADAKLLWSVPYYEPRLQQPTFTAEGAELLVVDHAGNLIRYNVLTGEDLGDGPEIEDCMFAVAGGGRTVALTPAGLVETWSDDPQERKQFTTGSVIASSAALSKDGTTLVLGLGHEVTIWDPSSQKRSISIQRHVTPVATIDYSPDGSLLATGSFAGEVRLWDASSGRSVEKLSEPTGRVFGVKVSPDGSRIGAVDWNGDVRIWDSETKKLVASFGEQSGSATGFDFSPDSKRVACASTDGVLRILDIATGQELIRGDGLDCISTILVEYSPDGKQLAVGTRDLLLIDAESGKQIRRWQKLGSPLTSIAWNPNGTYLAAGFAAKVIRLYDTTSKDDPRELIGHLGRITALAFTPSGDQLLSGSYGEHVVRVWNVDSGISAGQLQGYTEQILALAVSPDGKSVAVGGIDPNSVVLDLENLVQSK
ncbi:MAG: WD40 repeat protein [Planctomycetota bacterium]|jgi:WD40 repeat protein